MKVPARNQIPGKIAALHKGATTSHVIIHANRTQIVAPPPHAAAAAPGGPAAGAGHARAARPLPRRPADGAAAGHPYRGGCGDSGAELVAGAECVAGGGAEDGTDGPVDLDGGLRGHVGLQCRFTR